MDNQSFIVTKNIFFQAMIKRLNPNVRIYSADTIHNNIIKLFKNEKNNIKNELQKISSKISFTLDGWTSKNQISFLGITAHWITQDWKFKEILLDFHHFEGPHSGENISFVFFNILKEYEILQKVNINFIYKITLYTICNIL